MTIKEILIANPISNESIDQLFDEIELCDSQFLIINIGEHEFESLEVLKNLKNRFNKEKETLIRFKKIAFVHPKKYDNKSQDLNKYNYFCDREKAINWLTENN